MDIATGFLEDARLSVSSSVPPNQSLTLSQMSEKDSALDEVIRKCKCEKGALRRDIQIHNVHLTRLLTA